MKTLTLPQALFIHARLTTARGGKHGMRDGSSLKYALSTPNALFKDQPLYPDDFQQAAALLQALVEAQPFKEGSLTTALAITMPSLQRSGYQPEATKDELQAFAERVRTGEVLLLEMAVWIKGKCRDKKS